MSQRIETVSIVDGIPEDTWAGSSPSRASKGSRDRLPSKVRFELIVDGSRPLDLRQGLREVWTFREVIWAFAERNVRVKYKQAALGIVWALIQPLSFLAVFVVILGHAGGLSRGTTSYPAFALSTLVPWMFLQTAVSSGSQGLLSDGALLKKVYFVREAPVLAAVLSTCVDFSIGLALVLTIGPFIGAHLSWATFLVVPLFVMLFLLAAGVSMALGALTIYYRDIRHALPFALQVWMFASPVAYPLGMVPERWRSIYVVVNPAAGILDGFRRILAEGRAPDAGLIVISAVTTLVTASLGYVIFKRMEADFADAV